MRNFILQRALIDIFFPQFSNHNGNTPANPDLRIPRQIHIRTVIRAVHDARHAAVILGDSDVLITVPLHDAGHVVGLLPAALEQQPAVRHQQFTPAVADGVIEIQTVLAAVKRSCGSKSATLRRASAFRPR